MNCLRNKEALTHTTLIQGRDRGSHAAAVQLAPLRIRQHTKGAATRLKNHVFPRTMSYYSVTPAI